MMTEATSSALPKTKVVRFGGKNGECLPRTGHTLCRFEEPDMRLFVEMLMKWCGNGKASVKGRLFRGLATPLDFQITGPYKLVRKIYKAVGSHSLPSLSCQVVTEVDVPFL